MSAIPGPGSAWVRTRTPEDAKNFMAEKRMEQERAERPGIGTAVLCCLGVAALIALCVWALVS